MANSSRRQLMALIAEHKKRRKELTEKLPSYSPNVIFKELDRVLIKQRGLVYLFVSDPNHPCMRSKPPGVKGIGVRIALYDQDEIPETLEFVTLDSFNSVYVKLLFKESDRNKRIFIKAYYIGANGEEGPDSEIVSTVIS
jgi:hypothetical protein